MMTPFDLELGSKVKFNTSKDRKAMTSYKLFSHSNQW